MKKVALSLIALLAVGTFAFAEDVAAEKAVKNPVEVSLSAEGVAKFGYDLDTGVHGFKNSYSADLSLVIAPEADSTKSGTGDVYGTITIEDVSVKIAGDDGDETTDDEALLAVGTVTAKIIFPNGYVKLYEGTNPAVDYSIDGSSDDGEALSADDTFYTYQGRYGANDAVDLSDDDDQEWQFNDISTVTFIDSVGGITVGYTLPSLVELTLGVASENTWEYGEAGEDDNNYEASLEASLLAVENLTFKVKGLTASYYDTVEESTGNALGAGATVAYNFGVAAPFLHLNAQADVGEEGYLSSGFWASDIGTSLALAEGFKGVVAVKYDSASNSDVIATISLAKDKVIGPASADFGIWLRGLTDEFSSTDVFFKVGYDLGGGVGVWGKGSYNTPAVDEAEASLFLKAGIDAAIFPLVTLGAEWDSNDLGKAETVVGADGKAQPNGQVYLYAKVAY